MISNERFEEIKREVAFFLEDRDVRSVPIDVFGLARKLNIKYKFLSESLLKRNKSLYTLNFSDINAAQHYDKENNRVALLINDIGNYYNNQRFSMAHEIGHIVLGHDVQSETNEAEANFFANQLLVPSALLLNLSSQELDNENLTAIFGVSHDTLNIAIRNVRKRKAKFNKEYYEYEKIVINLLNDSLIDKIKKY